MHRSVHSEKLNLSSWVIKPVFADPIIHIYRGKVILKQRIVHKFTLFVKLDCSYQPQNLATVQLSHV